MEMTDDPSADSQGRDLAGTGPVLHGGFERPPAKFPQGCAGQMIAGKRGYDG